MVDTIDLESSVLYKHLTSDKLRKKHTGALSTDVIHLEGPIYPKPPEDQQGRITRAEKELDPNNATARFFDENLPSAD